MARSITQRHFFGGWRRRASNERGPMLQFRTKLLVKLRAYLGRLEQPSDGLVERRRPDDLLATQNRRFSHDLPRCHDGLG